MLEFILKPWHLMVLLLASHLNREQQGAIEYLHVENQVLLEKLGKEALRYVHKFELPQKVEGE